MQPTAPAERQFVADPTLYALYTTAKPYPVITGPVGSGKTSHICAFIMQKVLSIRPCIDGVRRSRGLVTRSTYPELESSILKTWDMWFGQYSVVKRGDLLTVDISAPLPDGTRVEAQLVLLALRHPDDKSKLRGVEFTWAWINEGSEVEPWVIDDVNSRLGRYPAKWQLGIPEEQSLKNGPDWWVGVVIDTNPPEEGAAPDDKDANWVYRMIEHSAKQNPQAYEIIKQPAALLRSWNESTNRYDYRPNPAATYATKQNQGYDYWLRMIERGLDEDRVRVLILGEYGMNLQGEPVFPEYSRSLHYVDVIYEPQRGRPLYIGADTSGTFPALILMQRSLRTGKLVVLHELEVADTGLEMLIEDYLKPLLHEQYVGCPVQVICDPANPRDTGRMMTPTDIFNRAGLAATTAYTNVAHIRTSTIRHYITTNKLLVTAQAPKLHRALSGKYIWGSSVAGRRSPKKVRPWADLVDGLGYVLMHFFYGDVAASTQAALPEPPPVVPFNFA